jgi:hypothetical protein
MKRVNLYVPEDLWNELKARVGDGEMSRTVRGLIQDFLDEHDRNRTRATANASRARESERDASSLGTASSSDDRHAPSIDELRNLGSGGDTTESSPGDDDGGDVDSEERSDDDDLPWYDQPIF